MFFAGFLKIIAPLGFSTIFLPQGSGFRTFFVPGEGGGEFALSKNSSGVCQRGMVMLGTDIVCEQALSDKYKPINIKTLRMGC